MNLWLRVTQLIICPWSLHSDGCFCEVSSLFRPPAPLPESSESEQNCHSLLLPYLPTRVPAYLLLFCWWEWESRSLPCVLKSPPSLFKNIAQTLLPSMPWIIISLPACIRFSYLEWKKKKKEKPQTRFKCYFPSNCHHISLFYFTAEFFFRKCPCSLTPVSLFLLSLEPTAVRLYRFAKTALSKVTTDFQWPFLIL